MALLGGLVAGRGAEPPRGALTAGLAFVIGAFALNSVVTRAIVAGHLLDPGLTTAVRFLAGAAVLAPLAARAGGGHAARPARSSVAPAFWLGAYAFAISYGYQHIGAAAGTLVFYACVLLTMTLAGAALEGQPPAPRATVGSLVALGGVAVLAAGRNEGATLLGVALLALTGAAWGAYSVLGRRRPDALAHSAANFSTLALALVPFAALLGAGVAGPVAFTTEGLALALLMGAVTTALSYVVWYWALARITRTQAGTYQMAIPVLAGAMGVFVLGEPLTVRLALAGACVLVGMALATPRAAKRPI